MGGKNIVHATRFLAVRALSLFHHINRKSALLKYLIRTLPNGNLNLANHIFMFRVKTRFLKLYNVLYSHQLMNFPVPFN